MLLLWQRKMMLLLWLRTTMLLLWQSRCSAKRWTCGLCTVVYYCWWGDRINLCYAYYCSRASDLARTTTIDMR